MLVFFPDQTSYGIDDAANPQNEVPFKSLWTDAIEVDMAPRAMINHFDVIKDTCFGKIARFVDSFLDTLFLQATKERLSNGYTSFGQSLPYGTARQCRTSLAGLPTRYIFSFGLNTAGGSLGECLEWSSRRCLSSCSSNFLFRITMSQLSVMLKHPILSD